MVEAYRDALTRAGRTDHELGSDLVIGYHFHMGDTTEDASREAARYFEENLKMFGPLRLVRSLSDEQIEVMSDPKRAPHADLPTIEGAVEVGGYLCGPPELMIERIMELEKRYPGLERVNVSHPMGAPESMILEHMQQFAEEVMPAFTDRADAPSPAVAG